jgi:ER degradation enhancer, mannosidase alpha-like 2
LTLAIDIGNRLLPAFRTTTGIPYGTVNLMKGVPKGETELASTAGAGSLLLEFEVLSCLSGDAKYGLAAMKAAEELYHLRSDIDLVGKHIHIRTGKWHETISGVGSNSDSFYEYLLKSYLLFRKMDHYRMFQDVYYAAKKHSLVGDWFVDVDMYSGKVRNKRSENLQAFWPGMEALMGMSDASGRLLNAFYLVWSEVGFLPEEFDYVNWATNGNKGFVSLLYPLRPELIESTYVHYRTTGDRSWLLAGRDFMESVEKYSRTECGYATVKDVTKRTLEDNMPSFFLSETCKYLFLLFDEENFIHTQREYIFTTEAHPIDPVQLSNFCPFHLDQTADLSLDGPEEGEGQGRSDEDNQSWSESLLGRVFNSLTGVGEEEEDRLEEDQEDFEMFSTAADQSMDDSEMEVNELDPSDISSAEDRRRREIESYSDWVLGRELHPHFMQCPRSHWWNLFSYRPGISSSSLAMVTTTPAPAAAQQEQQGSSFLDLSEFLKLMSQGHQRNFVDPFDPKTLCGVDDDLLPPAAATETVVKAASEKKNAKAPAERSVEVEVGAMGKFNVNVFTDGFVINSLKFGNTIEIAGVGSPTLFVKEYNSTSSSTIIATGSVLSTCNVRLHVDWPSDLWNKKAYNKKDFSPEELTKNRSPASLILPSPFPPPLSLHFSWTMTRCCSHAAFGPTSDPKNFPKHPLHFTATRAVDGVGCQSPPRHQGDSQEGDASHDTTAPPTASSSGGVSSSWFGWSKRRAKKDALGAPYAGHIVIADRGGCMFEEKVIQAETGGATGVIVINSEVPPPSSFPI